LVSSQVNSTSGGVNEIDGVHHYDENGLTEHSKEPKRIRDVHSFEVNFITQWIDQFHEEKAGKA
jgi:hypothetical protein